MSYSTKISLLVKKCILPVYLSLIATTSMAQSAKTSLPIGVFDSGTGGLTVLNALLTLDFFNNKTGEQKPDGKPDFESEYFQYLADQSNMPYGNYAAENKTDLLKEHILKNIDFLLGKQYATLEKNTWVSQDKLPVKMLVVACNTATAYALPDIKFYLNQQAVNVSVIGVIDAGAKAALEWQKKNGTGVIGVFATAGTVASNGYQRTLKAFAKGMGMQEPFVVSQGGIGLAESIDRDWAYFVDTLQQTRKDYKGPSIKNAQYPIDTALLKLYNFNTTNNKILCEYDGKGSCLDMQLNDPSNYVRYHLVSLLEGMLKTNPHQQMNTLILGCTHYPFLKDSIANVLKELYNSNQNGQYRYRNVLASEVKLIDPSVETAKEAYVSLRTTRLKNTATKRAPQFFISVPNTAMKEVDLQPDGWFTYQYKYGRVAGANKEYVKVVPFDDKNISSATYTRFKEAIPVVYAAIKKALY